MNTEYTRKDVTFSSHGSNCVAWLYLPKTEHPAPVIVMAHGLGGVKEMGLDAYGDQFCKAGYACLIFDYRYFGASEGKFRQMIHVRSQLEDWEAAIKYAGANPLVNGKKMALFGTSFSGGHVIATAAKHNELLAIVSQCPFTDGIASALAMNPFSSVKVTTLAIADEISRLTGFHPVKVQLAGPPWSTALMPVHDYQSYTNLIPKDFPVDEIVCARTAFEVLTYFPGKQAKNVNCPIYFAICDKDTVAPAKRSSQYAKQAKYGEVKHYNCGHFDIYHGNDFDVAVKDYIAFYKKHLS